MIVIARKRSRRRSRDSTASSGSPLEELHHEEDGAVARFAEVGDVDDVRVVDQARRARLAQEALDRFVAAAVALVEDLHGNFLTDVDVLARGRRRPCRRGRRSRAACTCRPSFRLGRPRESSCSIWDRASQAEGNNSSGKHACAICIFLEFFAGPGEVMPGRGAVKPRVDPAEEHGQLRARSRRGRSGCVRRGDRPWSVAAEGSIVPDFTTRAQRSTQRATKRTLN